MNLITERVGGWAAGLRLAALSLDGHPDPGLFIRNLAAEDNALTSDRVDEVLDAQPPPSGSSCCGPASWTGSAQTWPPS